ncbi:MAG: prepilin-type N-terminal cleavage/methylation domain-containing protein [Candidatus Riflebacteria bacterium]|nr:prepilin-type N-terminal cleavage/methylation domain-containing protein [Candidatus Riflebacteria bacterium]
MSSKTQQIPQSHSRHGQRGFTLVEVVVAIALFAGLIIVVSSMYSFIRRTFTRVDNKSAASSEIERFLLRLDSELRTASDVTVPSSDARSNCLTFVNQEGNEISYEHTEDETLIRTDYQSDTQREIMHGVASLTFSRHTRGLVEVSITVGQVSVLTAFHVWNLP